MPRAAGSPAPSAGVRRRDVLHGDVDRRVPAASATASRTNRDNALLDVRTFSSGSIWPSPHLQQRLDARPVPNSAAAAPIRPPRQQVLQGVDVEQRGRRVDDRHGRGLHLASSRTVARGRAAASTAKPRPMPVERESTTRMTPGANSSAARRAESQVPDSRDDRCTDTTCDAPASSACR